MARLIQIRDLHIELPLPLFERDWQAAIDAANGPTGHLLAAQGALVEVLRPLKPEPTTAEKLAWLSLWSRLYSLASAAMGVRDYGSNIGLAIIERAEYELTYQIQTIGAVGTADSPVSGPTAIDGTLTIARLRQYLAWCIWHDLRAWKRAARFEDVTESFDPTRQRERATRAPRLTEWISNLTGLDTEVVSDQEAEFDKERYLDKVKKLIAFCEALLDDPSLKESRDRLRSRQFKSFFDFLGLGETLPAFVRRQRARLGYLTYSLASGVLHGSTYVGTLHHLNVVVMPYIYDYSDELDKRSVTLSSALRANAVLLSLTTRALDAAGADDRPPAGA